MQIPILIGKADIKVLIIKIFVCFYIQFNVFMPTKYLWHIHCR